LVDIIIFWIVGDRPPNPYIEPSLPIQNHAIEHGQCVGVILWRGSIAALTKPYLGKCAVNELSLSPAHGGDPSSETSCSVSLVVKVEATF